MSDLLTAALEALHTALSHVFDAPLVPGTATFTGARVHAYPPPTVAAPCVWIEQSRGAETTIGATTVTRVDAATFPVVIVYDGADRAQIQGSTQLLARVWDAARTVGHPVAWAPEPVDVGGPTLRSTIVDVDMRLGASTLCGPPQLSQEVA